MVVILMGVSGSGKTTLGKMLSDATGWPFLDGDDFHPQANKDKMAGGVPLDDADRAPWLDTLHARIAEYVESGRDMIMACSALKSRYRQVLRGDLPPDKVQFALLTATQDCLAGHLASRHHQFMNPKLLDSQLATLEDPGLEAWPISVAGTPEESLAELRARLVEAGALAA